MTQNRLPITEAGFLQNPYGTQYYDYARHIVGSLIREVELKWHQGRAGISLDDFVHDVSINGIEQAKKDYEKGVLRKEKEDSFKTFFWHRIRKAFFAKLDELGKETNQAAFDERLGKYYEGTAIDFGPTGENDDIVENPNKDVILYYFSQEKAAVLEENYLAKMEYVKKILEIVSQMSPSDQRLFYLKYQFNFSDEDYQMWESISQQKHVKDPFTKMAQEKYGLSENYAKKRISQIKADLIAKLNQAGHTKESYRQNTSMPTTLQALTASPMPAFDFGLDIENLSEADCRDILFELFY